MKNIYPRGLRNSREDTEVLPGQDLSIGKRLVCRNRGAFLYSVRVDESSELQPLERYGEPAGEKERICAALGAPFGNFRYFFSPAFCGNRGHIANRLWTVENTGPKNLRRRYQTTRIWKVTRQRARSARIFFFFFFFLRYNF